jgi:transposase
MLESPWEMWRLLTLETRMESCRRNSRRGSRPPVGTARRRRRARCGWCARLRAELGTEHGTVRRVARQLGYGIESVRSWVRQADIDDGHAPGVSTTDARKLKELEQEVRELRRANEILKRAASFFGAELDRQHKR